jgi:hypothetical protein
MIMVSLSNYMVSLSPFDKLRMIWLLMIMVSLSNHQGKVLLRVQYGE